MKLLNTLEELLLYCKFCPICLQDCRTLTVESNINSKLSLINFLFEKDNLIVEMISNENDSKVNINIDCKNNLIINHNLPNFARNENFYLLVSANCNHCNFAYIYSSDIKFDFINFNIIKNSLKIENESVYFVHNHLDDKYHITINYLSETILLSKCTYSSQLGIIVDDNKIISLPLVELDFTKPDKVINKIKTLLLFT